MNLLIPDLIKKKSEIKKKCVVLSNSTYLLISNGNSSLYTI